MKKSNFVALVLGTISGVFFALGMCMATLPEWNAFRPGVGLGCLGLLMAMLTVAVWRKMEQKEPIKISGKAVVTILIALAGSLALGVGMVNVMVWANLIAGIVIGLVGIVILLMLIPVCKGLK
ncbi:MAG: hypothetical protein PHP50_13295 [Lachnospiraceae bacterium]|nr:hypothetical protein [Lachnospiraceae bacterium]